MALPERHYRGDIIVMVDWTATNGVGVAHTNFCGATSVSLSLDNAVQEETVADCDDWSLPPQNLAEYGAQTWNISINATLAKQNRDLILRAAADQRLLPVRIHIKDAPAGQEERRLREGILRRRCQVEDPDRDPDRLRARARH